MANTATRLITLIMLLQRRPNQKARILAEELDVSVRSLHRYIGMLEEMGIPVSSERGPHGGFSLVRGYKMPPLIFTPEEATAVYLGTSLVREMWGKLYRDAAQGALAKLDNVLPHEQQQEIAWARDALVATGMVGADHETVAAHLEKLRQAIRERRQIHLLYRRRNQPEPQPRDLNPYALVYRWGWWYFVGYCHLRQAVRSFRVDRIADLTLLSKLFDAPEEFDVHEYLANELEGQPQIKVRMRFLPAAAHVGVDGRFQWNSMEKQSDGSVIVSFNTPDMEWAISKALSYGSSVVVLEPANLQQLVRERAQAVADSYQ